MRLFHNCWCRTSRWLAERSNRILKICTEYLVLLRNVLFRCTTRLQLVSRLKSILQLKNKYRKLFWLAYQRLHYKLILQFPVHTHFLGMTEHHLLQTRTNAEQKPWLPAVLGMLAPEPSQAHSDTWRNSRAAHTVNSGGYISRARNPPSTFSNQVPQGRKKKVKIKKNKSRGELCFGQMPGTVLSGWGATRSNHHAPALTFSSILATHRIGWLVTEYKLSYQPAFWSSCTNTTVLAACLYSFSTTQLQL